MSHLPLTDRESTDRLVGIGLMCAAVTTFTIIDTSAKYAVQAGVPTLEVVWARYALSVVFSIILLRPWRRWSDYRTRRPAAQALRALFLLASTGLNFVALRYLQISETTSITFAAPLIVTALAGPILGEWAGPRRWAAVAIGFVGVLIIVEPGTSTFQPAAIYSVAAAFCYAGYALMTRQLSGTETPGGMLIYGSLLSAILLTPVLPSVAVAPPNWTIAVTLTITGLAAAFGHWFMIHASRHAPAPVLAPFSYIQLLPTVALGYVVFGDVPSASTLIGALVIVASGLYVLYRERVHRDR